MYILKIETFSAGAVELLKELKFDKQYTEQHHNGINYVFEDKYTCITNVDRNLTYYKDLLDEFDDTEVYYHGYESEFEKWDDTQSKGNLYDYYGVDEKDFY